jgi:hypothetical protein
MGWGADPSVRRWPRGRRSPWSAPTNCSCWLSAVLRRHLAACPAARITRTRSVHEQPRYSPISWQRIAFLQSARSARSSTWGQPRAPRLRDYLAAGAASRAGKSRCVSHSRRECLKPWPSLESHCCVPDDDHLSRAAERFRRALITPAWHQPVTRCARGRQKNSPKTWQSAGPHRSVLQWSWSLDSEISAVRRG